MKYNRKVNMMMLQRNVVQQITELKTPYLSCDLNYYFFLQDVKMVGQDGDNASADQKPKVDIWKKRTVGDVFEDAIARYWQRVAARRG